MMYVMLKKLRTLGCLGLLIGQMAMASGPKGPTKDLRAYIPSVSCTDAEARKILEELNTSGYNPFGDGVGSWPLLTGVWANRDRNVYFGIAVRQFNRIKGNYYVQVNMYSLCSRELLATGSGFYSIQNPKMPKAIQLQLVKVSRDLRIHRMNLTLITPEQKNGELKIRLEGIQGYKSYLIDEFLASRPEKLINREEN